MSALSLKRYSSDFVRFVQKMKCRGKVSNVIIVAFMKKFSIFFGMLKQMKNFDKKLAFFLEPKDGIYTNEKISWINSKVYGRI